MSYQKQTTPFYAAARLWVDEIIDPRETRAILTNCLSVANGCPVASDFKTGVMQV